MTATQLTFFSPESAPAALTPDTDQPALPNGWRWAKLGDVCEFNYGKALPKGQRSDGSYPVYGSNGVVGFHNDFVVKEPTIIVGRKGAAGAVHLTKLPCFPIDTTYYLTTSQTIDLTFLYYSLKTLQLEKLDKSTAIPGLNRNDAYRQIIPLPPLAEQQRIVARVEELLSEVDAGVTEIEAALKRLKMYRQAVLHHFLVNPEWAQVKLGEIASVTGGLTKNGKREALPLQVPYLRVANVYANRLDLTEVKEIGVAESEIERTLLKYGDLLVVEGNGSIEQVGRAAIWKEEIPYCLHQNHLIKIRFKNPAASTFLLTWLISPVGREAIEKQASSTSGLHTLSISKIAGLTIPFPDLTTQNRAVQEIEARLSQADALEATLRTELQRAGRLRQSVLKQAFLGKLIPSVPL